MLKDVYPQYQDEVAFFAIGMDPSESLSELEAYSKSQGYTWPMALANPDLFPSYRVIIRSTKIAVDQRGVITWRAGYGVEDEETWHRIFQALVS